MTQQQKPHDSSGTYEEMLQGQARELKSLSVRAGNPSYRTIEKRAAALFADERASLPPSTQTALFNGSYAGRDKLMWLVRTLLSWDRFGRPCEPPAYGAAELDEWDNRWTAITEARPPRQRVRTAPAFTVTESPTTEKNLTPPPSKPQQADVEPSSPPTRPSVLFTAGQMLWIRQRVWAVAFSPDGALLATGEENGMVRLWDPVTGQPAGKPLTSRQRVWAVAFSPDGALLATGADDGMVRLWDPVTGRPAVGDPLPGHHGAALAVAFSPDGALLAAGGGMDGTVRLWDPVTGRPAVGDPLPGHHGAALTLAFSPDGSLLATGGEDGMVWLWDPVTGQPAGAPIAGSKNRVRAVAFSPDGTLLAAGGEDGMVRLWDPVTGQPVSVPLTGHRGSVRAVAFSPDGTLFATSGDGGTVRLWERREPLQPRRAAAEPLGMRALSHALQEGRPVALPALGTGSPVLTVAFSPDGTLLATGSRDGTVRLWVIPVVPDRDTTSGSVNAVVPERIDARSDTDVPRP
ncbi:MULTISPECIES: WD40 repeat domain-containing protein [unclassified Streptomyces]|uniref:WD40 repeat domain-containing protein n=1 Tax=unclassified Streptomyces TaxID=2593676 RepID=UPI000A98057E|nr:WD40 repeat domain-containing protein [Streptomyces sp. CB01883]